MAESRELIGKPVARNMNDSTRERNLTFLKKLQRKPLLAVLISPDPSAKSYMKTILSTASEVQAEVREVPVDKSAPSSAITAIVKSLNRDPAVDGILVQEPLPEGVKLEMIGRVIDSVKDADGITPMQSGLLFRGAKSAIIPPTAKAVMEILDYYRYGLEGLEVVVLGRSLVVGKPVGILALNRSATVTWCHTKTKSLPAICKRADVLIIAIGKAKMIDSRYVRPGATVIDVGVNVDENGKLCGDVDSNSIRSIAAAYTPVPGGIGPVTTACLFANLSQIAENAAPIGN
jgi:methylenetetrahydrofolate dehydrogenase (NADP+) / methenyltetrahydrofolate cyclohydrolase